jgi:hypothetical protein
MDLKNPKATQDQTRVQVLAQELSEASTKQNFASIICQAFEGLQLTDEFCNNLSKLLKLTFAQHVALGLALSHSNEQSVQQQGKRIDRGFVEPDGRFSCMCAQYL